MKTPLQLLMEQSNIQDGDMFYIKDKEGIKFFIRYQYKNNELLCFGNDNDVGCNISRYTLADLFVGKFLIAEKVQGGIVND